MLAVDRADGLGVGLGRPRVEPRRPSRNSEKGVPSGSVQATTVPKASVTGSSAVPPGPDAGHRGVEVVGGEAQVERGALVAAVDAVGQGEAFDLAGVAGPGRGAHRPAQHLAEEVGGPIGVRDPQRDVGQVPRRITSAGALSGCVSSGESSGSGVCSNQRWPKGSTMVPPRWP